jgi:hypothetical protein
MKTYPLGTPFLLVYLANGASILRPVRGTLEEAIDAAQSLLTLSHVRAVVVRSI